MAVPRSSVCTAGPNVLLNHCRGGRRDIFARDIHSSSVELQAEVSLKCTLETAPGEASSRAWGREDKICQDLALPPHNEQCNQVILC